MTLAACFGRPIAHRGLHACGGSGPVENSLGAAKAAILANFGIECDVQLSRDGEAIVFHDERLDRLTSRSGALADHTAATLATMSLTGSHETIPTLSDLLATVSGRVPLVIEIKAGAHGDMRLAERVLTLVALYDGDIVIESFDPHIVLYCLDRALCPVGLVGPRDVDPGDIDQDDIEVSRVATDAALRRCTFVSWSIAALADIAARYPEKPRTTWTVRTPDQMTIAHRHAAQIVFEAIDPDIIY